MNDTELKLAALPSDLVEFIGFPCVGKTTLARKLSGSLRPAALADAGLTTSRLFRLLVFIGRRPSTIFPLATVRLVPLRAASDQVRAWGRFVSRLGELQSILKRSDRRVIVDEGVIQATWGLYLRVWIEGNQEAGEKSLRRHIENFWVPSADLSVIYLHAPAAELERHFRARDRKHFFSEAQVRGDPVVVAAGRKLMATILRSARERYVVRRSVSTPATDASAGLV